MRHCSPLPPSWNWFGFLFIWGRRAALVTLLRYFDLILVFLVFPGLSFLFLELAKCFFQMWEMEILPRGTVKRLVSLSSPPDFLTKTKDRKQGVAWEWANYINSCVMWSILTVGSDIGCRIPTTKLSLTETFMASVEDLYNALTSQEVGSLNYLPAGVCCSILY